MALVALALAILPILVATPITTRDARESILASQGQLGLDLSAEEQAKMEEAANIFSSPLIITVLPAIGRVMLRVAGWLVGASALYLAIIVLGGRSSFAVMLRMVIWTWVPFALRSFLQVIYTLVSGQIIRNEGLSGLVVGSSSPSATLNLGQIILVEFLSRLDVFLVWNLVLVTIGIMVTTRLTRSKSTLATLAVWFLLTTASLLPTAVFALVVRQFAIG